MWSTPLPCIRAPRIIAHRGASETHPENTIAAFDQALVEGCDGIELDLQLSRDGIPMVYHDRTLDKIGGGRHGVADLDATEIGALDAGTWLDSRHSGQRVPTLGLVLDRYGQETSLLLELKVRQEDKLAGRHTALARATVAHLRTRRPQTVMVLCFDLDTLDAVSALDPECPTVLNLKAPDRMTRPLSRALARVAALSIDVSTISPEVVSAAHEANTPVLAWTCNTPATVGRALDASADGLMSDRPGWLRDTVSNRSAAGPTE